MDSVRRLTLALLLASVAALGASLDDVPGDDDRTMTEPPPRLPTEVPWRLGTRTVYDERRCSERVLTATTVSLLELVQRP